ncbi:hypothetical protein RXV94_09070 [Yeosuana sp. MJ-SS3]|uniref:Phage protein n=1 Tax=Gilvirhabdus luticola TaxID=3079858 RepID=A0ABU3U7C6_9FLAO|nr:hypothetical protein [Yeosuana sp. MJ-SS3]MDU8886309.1 hypothetical protein [Yeosuana sp. MJ-SS3]
MTPKEQAEELLREWDFRGTPFNDAGIFVSEMIYENKKYNSDNINEKGYWELVKEELEKMRANQITNMEREILKREYGYEESEEKPINYKTINESKSGHNENEKVLEEMSNNQKFHLRIYDNYHYMDESEAYNHGQYDSYEDAMIGAQKIVDEFFEHNWKPGVTPNDLMVQYCLYGEDPIILPNEHGKHKSFSARTYAEISAVKICRKLENK